MPNTQPKANAQAQRLSNADLMGAAVSNLTDQMFHLETTQEAFEAVERLVTPVGANDLQIMDIERREMGSLLRVLNRAMRSDLETAQAMAEEVRRWTRMGGATAH